MYNHRRIKVDGAFAVLHPAVILVGNSSHQTPHKTVSLIGRKIICPYIQSKFTFFAQASLLKNLQISDPVLPPELLQIADNGFFRWRTAAYACVADFQVLLTFL